MSKRLKATVDRIMSDAYVHAWVEIRHQVYRMMKRNPKRFKTYVHAVGWGPSFFGPNGQTVDIDEMNSRERELYDYLVRFYDAYGGNNARVEL